MGNVLHYENPSAHQTATGHRKILQSRQKSYKINNAVNIMQLPPPYPTKHYNPKSFSLHGLLSIHTEGTMDKSVLVFKVPNLKKYIYISEVESNELHLLALL